MSRHNASLDRAVRAVAFDVDGTLYPIRSIAGRSLSLVCAHLRLFHAFGRARQALRREVPGPALRQRQAVLVAGMLGIEPGDAARRIEQVIYRQWPSCFGRLRPYAGVVETLQHLRRSGLRLGVVSDSPFTRQKLAALDLRTGWDAVVSADDVGALKPNPEPFLRIAELLEAAPHEVLFVGDSYARDVVGAHRVGMRTAHFTRRPVRAGVAAVSFSRYRSFPHIPRPEQLAAERGGI